MTTTTLTTAQALRSAADLLEAIGWTTSITWSGTDRVSLHHKDPGDDLAAPATLIALGDLGGIVTDERLIQSIVTPTEFTAWSVRMPDDLWVDVLGPHYPVPVKAGAWTLEGR